MRVGTARRNTGSQPGGKRMMEKAMFSRQAVDALKDAESVVVLTGAGVSAESGVPTFRGAGGLWREYSATSLATPEAFRADPGSSGSFTTTAARCSRP